MATPAEKLLIACIGLVFVWNDILAGTVLFQCDFEKGDTCGMEQDTKDTPCQATFQAGCTDGTFKWILHSSGTPTDGTGPDTGNARSEFYVYMESTNARGGNYARLFITDGQLQGYKGPVCVQFYYHMYSKLENTMGELSVEFVHNDEPFVAWSISGNQPNEWNKKRVTIVMGERDKIGFTGTLGSTAFSDIGLDDIRVDKGSCDESDDQFAISFDAGATYTTHAYGGRVGNIVYDGSTSGLAENGIVEISCDVTYNWDSFLSMSVDISDLFLCNGDSVTVANYQFQHSRQCASLGNSSQTISGKNNALTFRFTSYSPTQTSFRLAFTAPKEVYVKCEGNYTATKDVTTRSRGHVEITTRRPRQGEITTKHPRQVEITTRHPRAIETTTSKRKPEEPNAAESDENTDAVDIPNSKESPSDIAMTSPTYDFDFTTSDGDMLSNDTTSGADKGHLKSTNSMMIAAVLLFALQAL